jgi:SWI/SNF-related matrix-associated actin-dependent regulator 1 of chromatin subfamily A
VQVLLQAEDRAHRIGQLDSVVVQYLIAQGTADDHLWNLLEKKLAVLNKAGLNADNLTATASASTKRLEVSYVL